MNIPDKLYKSYDGNSGKVEDVLFYELSLKRNLKRFDIIMKQNDFVLPKCFTEEAKIIREEIKTKGKKIPHSQKCAAHYSGQLYLCLCV